VRFEVPQAPVVRGQFAVLFDGDLVLGGGVITQVLPAPAANLGSSTIEVTP
jgi:hypothetical protein